MYPPFIRDQIPELLGGTTIRLNEDYGNTGLSGIVECPGPRRIYFEFHATFGDDGRLMQLDVKQADWCTDERPQLRRLPGSRSALEQALAQLKYTYTPRSVFETAFLQALLSYGDNEEVIPLWEINLAADDPILGDRNDPSNEYDNARAFHDALYRVMAVQIEAHPDFPLFAATSPHAAGVIREREGNLPAAVKEFNKYHQLLIAGR